jgi:hypothetical protein
MGIVRWLCFNLLMIGTPLSFLLNPIFWGMTVAYFATRTQLVTELFPRDVYYPSLILLLVGNFGLLCELMLTCLQEVEHTRGQYGLVKYMLLAPVMWLWISRSTYIAVFEMAVGKRTWHKTPHGHEIGDDADDVGVGVGAGVGVGLGVGDSAGGGDGDEGGGKSDGDGDGASGTFGVAGAPSETGSALGATTVMAAATRTVAPRAPQPMVGERQ